MARNQPNQLRPQRQINQRHIEEQRRQEQRAQQRRQDRRGREQQRIQPRQVRPQARQERALVNVQARPVHQQARQNRPERREAQLPKIKMPAFRPGIDDRPSRSREGVKLSREEKYAALIIIAAFLAAMYFFITIE